MYHILARNPDTSGGASSHYYLTSKKTLEEAKEYAKQDIATHDDGSSWYTPPIITKEI